MKRNEYRNLEKQIGYKFRRVGRIAVAMTHRSYRFENNDVTEDNQRLEFLGDAVLGFAIAARLFDKYPDKAEGSLTTFRSVLTSGKSLAAMAVGIDLGEFLMIGKGEERSGGRKRESNLADAFEALIGAAYEDGGMKAIEKIVRKLFDPIIDELQEDSWAENPKGQLQEYCQRIWKSGPVYRLVSREGPPHASVFTVEAFVKGRFSGTGVARNKQEAEQKAALSALKHLGQQK
ncbi:MAG: ribonuclease III [Lentisphaerae bacterium]|nr:ribonuclease III [Lentisphaerota bacterium]